MTSAVLPEITLLNEKIAKISLSNAVSTPDDYAKFTFPLPHERYVGLLACQRDPNLRSLETIVTACRKKAEVSSTRSNGKEKGKQRKAVAPEEELWEVELLDTVLFPEGGGQASDTGKLILLDEPNAGHITVKEVLRRHLNAVHICTSPISPQSRVLVEVDWTRRHDLCTQHTAQHLLSAVLEHHFKIPTLGWALSGFPNVSYIEVPRCPSKEELVETERVCNDLIVEGRRVRIDMQLSQDTKRPDTLPADYIGGVVRTVIIDDLDENPCCGTHYHSLAPLQGIHVSQFTSPVRGTNTRIYFLAGPRIAQQLTSSLNLLRATGSELSCGNDDIPGRVKILGDNLKEMTRREKRLREEVAESLAAKIVEKARSNRGHLEGHLLAAVLREEDSTNDIDFLLFLQDRIKQIIIDTGNQQSHTFALAQVGSTERIPDGCVLVFSSDEAVVSRFAAEIKHSETQLAKMLKGGGKGRWQGKVVEGRLRKDRDEAQLLEMLNRAIA